VQGPDARVTSSTNQAARSTRPSRSSKSKPSRSFRGRGKQPASMGGSPGLTEKQEIPSIDAPQCAIEIGPDWGNRRPSLRRISQRLTATISQTIPYRSKTTDIVINALQHRLRAIPERAATDSVRPALFEGASNAAGSMAMSRVSPVYYGRCARIKYLEALLGLRH